MFQSWWYGFVVYFPFSGKQLMMVSLSCPVTLVKKNINSSQCLHPNTCLVIYIDSTVGEVGDGYDDQQVESCSEERDGV